MSRGNDQKNDNLYFASGIESPSAPLPTPHQSLPEMRETIGGTKTTVVLGKGSYSDRERLGIQNQEHQLRLQPAEPSALH